MTTKERIVSLTKHLISFRTTHDGPEELVRCAEYAAGFFGDTNLSVDIHTNEGIPSVVVTKGTKRPKIFLYAHIDVVDGEDAQFNATTSGDKLHGRGAFDMKGSAAVVMELMKYFAETDHDVALMLVGDEEVGGWKSTGWLTGELGYGCDIALVTESGMPIEYIVVGEKGKMSVRITAVGTPAHGSRPWIGDNAIMRLAEALKCAESAFTDLLDHPDDHWVTTFSPGIIRGGVAENQVPDRAYVDCDIRYIADDSEEQILERLRAKMPERVTVDAIVSNVLPREISPNNAYFQSYVEITKAVTDRDPILHRTHGTSDARFFADTGSVVLMSQADGAGHHGDHEWVSIESLGQYYEILKTFIERHG